MCKRKLILFLLLFPTIALYNQELIHIDSIKNDSNIQGYLVEAMIEGDDTLIHVQLKSITILPPFKFKSRKQKRRYSRLVRYVKKVYPYSIIVSEQMNDIHQNLEEYSTKKEKQQFIKEKEKVLKKEFEGKLRKLTYSQGRILMKLINRETGFTTYEIVKELKGSLNAFFWQSLARLFGSSLKLEYDPKGDDKMIEDIVIRIENGEI
ncbi:MAG: DUF4294 domain-containing protein [Bacteroidetes bacterium]|nr:MAG: DUF4294 domain-containing protein [Bacteroidota bacterium]RLD77488.1 MAG: DUF4294 domain-containing protein [Bacteroidota bacterium]